MRTWVSISCVTFILSGPRLSRVCPFLCRSFSLVLPHPNHEPFSLPFRSFLFPCKGTPNTRSSSRLFHLFHFLIAYFQHGHLQMQILSCRETLYFAFPLFFLWCNRRDDILFGHRTVICILLLVSFLIHTLLSFFPSFLTFTRYMLA